MYIIYKSRCKYCDKKQKVYHLDWCSITCSNCKKQIKIKQFLRRILTIKYK